MAHLITPYYGLTHPYSCIQLHSVRTTNTYIEEDYMLEGSY